MARPPAPKFASAPLRRPTTWGLAAGFALYAVLLALHLYQHKTLKPHLGCVIGLEQDLLNRPAHVLVAALPNRTIAPQTYGDDRPPPDSPEALDATWSPIAFIAWGAVFYALTGAMIGYGVARIRRIR